jgi:hypothetical protein
MFLLGGVLIGLIASGRMALYAQVGGKLPSNELGRSRRDVTGQTPSDEARAPIAQAPTRASREPDRPGQASIQDVLLRPYHFPFSRPTSLAQVCLHLKQTLGVPVVLDLAALDRQDVDSDDTVQLELEGVRLKTGLKLLLDQVGLTYHVVPDDNLLIITDREGSDDPLDRIWSELRTLHRDLHDVQDAVDELLDALYGEEQEGPRVRKPTIIEEKPDRDPSAPQAAEGARPDPKGPARSPNRFQPPSRPGTSLPPNPPRGGRPTPSRVPLSAPGRTL